MMTTSSNGGRPPDSGRSTYIVAGPHAWHREAFERLRTLPGEWCFVASPDELAALDLAALAPRYLFFLHWSWRVPHDVVRAHECVCFHMTDVPYGRGGSPLQNLILRGHRTTRLTALRMVEERDAGPVYLKEDLSLEGPAHAIYRRATDLSVRMVERILRERPVPTPQTGAPVVFARRKPHESALPLHATPEQLYDFIRMLDAPGYPTAFIEHGGIRVELKDAKMESGRVVARATITVKEEKHE